MKTIDNLKKQEKALKKALLSIIGDIGSYDVINDVVIYNIDYKKLNKYFKDQDSYKLFIPSIDYLNKKAKSIYKDFNLKCIYYKISNIDFDKKVEIDGLETNVLIDSCNFNKGLIVYHSNNLEICSSDKNEILVNGLFKVNSKNLIIDNCSINHVKKYSDFIINSDNLQLFNNEIISIYDVKIFVKDISMNYSILHGANVLIDFDEFNNNNSEITSKKEVLLNSLKKSKVKKLKKL